MLSPTTRTIFCGYIRREKSGAPLSRFDLADGLNLIIDDKSSEVDIEGASGYGDLTFWISSHGTNKNGLYRPNRHRLFCTSVTAEGEGVKITPVGTAYSTLLDDLSKDTRYKNLIEWECTRSIQISAIHQYRGTEFFAGRRQALHRFPIAADRWQGFTRSTGKSDGSYTQRNQSPFRRTNSVSISAVTVSGAWNIRRITKGILSAPVQQKTPHHSGCTHGREL